MAVLNPTPGIEVRTSARGWASRREPEVRGQRETFGVDVSQLGGDAGDDATELGGAGDRDLLRLQGELDLGGRGVGQPR